MIRPSENIVRGTTVVIKNPLLLLNLMMFSLLIEDLAAPEGRCLVHVEPSERGRGHS